MGCDVGGGGSPVQSLAYGDKLVGKPEARHNAEEPAVVHAVECGAEVNISIKYILFVEFGIFEG